MSKVREKDLQDRYKQYRRRVQEIKKELRETEARAVAMIALEYHVTERTIRNAINHRPSKASKRLK